jgi:hypothetical protein
MECTQEMLHGLTAVLKESAAKGETAKTTITAPPHNDELREQRRRKRKSSDDADKSAKKPKTSTTGVEDPQLRSKDEVPTRNCFAPLSSTEMEADHGDEADDTKSGAAHNTGWMGVNCIRLIQDRAQRRALVVAVMNLRVSLR